MKKHLLIGASLLALGITTTAIYAQVTGTSVVDKMKAVAHSFTLAATLNPSDSWLTSDPVKGKKTGDILTAGEWNRVLELVGEGGSGSGGSGELVMSEMSPTAYANLIDAVNYCRNLTENGITNWKFPTYGDLVNFIDPKYSQDMVWVADFDGSQSASHTIVKDFFASIRLSDGYWSVSTPADGANKVRCVAQTGGGSPGGGLALYKCTNAQSLDTTNAPCYGASRNGGAGTNQYRVVSCTDNDGVRSYTMSSILNFWQLVANKWAVSVNGGTIECDDGTVLVMDTQSGGSTLSVSSSWTDISLTDTVDFDVSCEYRAYVPKNAQQTENSWQYFIGVTPKRLRSAPSNDSEVYIPSSDKKAFYITPYGRADAWGLLVTKIQKRCN